MFPEKQPRTARISHGHVVRVLTEDHGIDESSREAGAAMVSIELNPTNGRSGLLSRSTAERRRQHASVLGLALRHPTREFHSQHLWFTPACSRTNLVRSDSWVAIVSRVYVPHSAPSPCSLSFARQMSWRAYAWRNAFLDLKTSFSGGGLPLCRSILESPWCCCSFPGLS